MWRHPLLRGGGVCTQGNKYKYLKNAMIRKPLLYLVLLFASVQWNAYEDDKWRRLHCLLLSMILIMVMVMIKWWSDSDDDKHIIRNLAININKLLHHTFSGMNCLRHFVIMHLRMKFVFYVFTFLYWLKKRLSTKSIQEGMAQVSPLS